MNTTKTTVISESFNSNPIGIYMFKVINKNNNIMNVVLHMFNVNNKITRTKSLILVSLMLSLNTFCATYSTVFLTLNM